MSQLLLAIIGNIVIGISIVASILFVKIIRIKLVNYIDYLTAITVGLILGIIFLGLIPEINEEGLSGYIFGIHFLIGIFIFYVLELFLHFHHCKDLDSNCNHQHNHSKEHKNGALMLTGTILHNLLHGVVLFSAFGVSNSFGIVTTIAILLHSIPQNIANYIMNHNKIIFPIIAAFSGVIGAIILYPFSELLIEYKTNLLAFVAGGLLYLSLTDILPEIKEKGSNKNKVFYLFCLILGLILFIIVQDISDETINNFEKNHILK